MNVVAFAKKYGILVVLVLLVVLFSIASPAFLSVTNLFNVARQVSMLGIVAVGVTFVMISGGMDLSVGSQMALVGIIGAELMVNLGVSPVLAVILCILTGTFVGLLNGLTAIRLNVHPLIVTLGSMTIIKGVSFIISGGLPVFGFPKSFSIIGQGYLGVVPIPVIIMLLITLLGSFILNKTYIGRYIYALGGNEEATRLAGVNIKGLKVFMYSLSGFFTGIAGIIMLSRINSGQPNAGAGYEFDVMTAAVLGGVSIKGGEGKISGVFVGVLIIGILSNGLILMNIGEYYQNVVKGLVLLLAVALDGIEGSRKRKAARNDELVKVAA